MKKLKKLSHLLGIVRANVLSSMMLGFMFFLSLFCPFKNEKKAPVAPCYSAFL